MRRDYFTLDVRGVEWVSTGERPEQPKALIDFEGPSSLLQERITGHQAEVLDESSIDVSFRFLTELDDADPTGVISVTNRVTGDYILELNTSGDEVVKFIKAAGEYGREHSEDDGKYKIVLMIDGEEVVSFEKRTFLMYNREGNLLREYSLIPSGVEL